MFVTDGESNYDRVCKQLLAIARDSGVYDRAALLGGESHGETAVVPLFGSPCMVETDGVYRNGSRLDIIGSILVLRYLLTGGDAPFTYLWTPYRHFRDGSQFASYIKTNIEDKMAAAFGGRVVGLQKALEALGGVRYIGNDIQADLAMKLLPLPKIPVLCLFRDKDEEFGASVQMLFDASAPYYLDLESLAVLLEYIYLKVVGQ